MSVLSILIAMVAPMCIFTP
ncbi:hypothetical protein [Photobacterium leiognathi]